MTGRMCHGSPCNGLLLGTAQGMSTQAWQLLRPKPQGNKGTLCPVEFPFAVHAFLVIGNEAGSDKLSEICIRCEKRNERNRVDAVFALSGSTTVIVWYQVLSDLRIILVESVSTCQSNHRICRRPKDQPRNPKVACGIITKHRNEDYVQMTMAGRAPIKGC